MDPLIGEIKLFAGNFAPLGWAFCNGQVLAIAQYQALYSLLGITYGGNGTTTFNLPDLRGRVPVHVGQGTGLSNYALGAKGGAESVTLTTAQLPAHNHTLNASSAPANQTLPVGNFSAVTVDGPAKKNSYSNTTDGAMAAGAVSSVGANQAHSNLQPYACVNFIIALEGIYPSRP